jgi:excisionase family DNA binding protein
MTTSAPIKNNSKSSQPLFLSMPKAARRLGVSTPTAKRMARSGKLPVVQIGRRQMVVASALNVDWFRHNAGQDRRGQRTTVEAR